MVPRGRGWPGGAGAGPHPQSLRGSRGGPGGARPPTHQEGAGAEEGTEQDSREAPTPEALRLGWLGGGRPGAGGGGRVLGLSKGRGAGPGWRRWRWGEQLAWDSALRGPSLGGGPGSGGSSCGHGPRPTLPWCLHSRDPGWSHTGTPRSAQALWPQGCRIPAGETSGGAWGLSWLLAGDPVQGPSWGSCGEAPLQVPPPLLRPHGSPLEHTQRRLGVRTPGHAGLLRSRPRCGKGACLTAEEPLVRGHLDLSPAGDVQGPQGRGGTVRTLRSWGTRALWLQPRWGPSLSGFKLRAAGSAPTHSLWEGLPTRAEAKGPGACSR